MSSDLPEGILDTGGGQEGDSADSSVDEESYERFTIFQIGTHRLAIPVTAVDSIINRFVDVTRVPRSPPSIEGVTDIRGQITTLVDPHVLFPDSGGPIDSPSLLVFADREQPAAIHVDDVEGVEAVLEENVIDQSEYDADEIDGTALAHPLIVGAIRVEHRRRGDVVESVVGTRAGAESAEAANDPALGGASDESEPDDSGVVVGEFSLDDGDEPTDGAGSSADSQLARTDDVEVEITPILDVDRFLLASGRIEEGRDPVEPSAAESSN